MESSVEGELGILGLIPSSVTLQSSHWALVSFLVNQVIELNYCKVSFPLMCMTVNTIWLTCALSIPALLDWHLQRAQGLVLAVQELLGSVCKVYWELSFADFAGFTFLPASSIQLAEACYEKYDCPGKDQATQYFFKAV